MPQQVRLTAVTLADAPSINRWKNDQEIQARSSPTSGEEALADTEARIARWQLSDPAEIAHFAIRSVPSGELVGFCHLADIDLTNRSCKVGLVIGERELWGSGYGTATVAALLEEAARRGLTRVVAEVYGDNARSQRLFSKCGFALEGTLRASALRGERWIDELIYGWVAAKR